VAAVALALALAAAPSLGRGAGWFPLTPALLPRIEAAAEIVNGRIYQAAGFVNGAPATQVERYDIATGRWSLVAPTPVSINHTSAATYGGKLYLVGGYMGDPATFVRGDGLSVAIFLEYDPAADRWRELTPPPTKRGAVATGVIGHKLYVAGGWNTSEGDLGRLEIYDFRTGRWSRGADMGFARNHVVGTVADGKLYAIGGHTGLFITGVVLPYVERYDPAADRWQRLADLSHPRSGAGVVTVGDRVVVYGGETREDVVRHTEIFDPRTGLWSPLPDMLTPVHGLGDVSYGNRVYAIAGSPMPRAGQTQFTEALDIPPLPAAATPRLRISARPRTIVARRSVRVRFRVTARSRAGAARPVAGARVGFAGVRIPTDGRGRAALVTRLDRAGPHPVRARRRGFRSGSATVWVRPRPRARR
jgi:hypothetical protein